MMMIFMNARISASADSNAMKKWFCPCTKLSHFPPIFLKPTNTYGAWQRRVESEGSQKRSMSSMDSAGLSCTMTSCAPSLSLREHAGRLSFSPSSTLHSLLPPEAADLLLPPPRQAYPYTAGANRLIQPQSTTSKA